MTQPSDVREGLTMDVGDSAATALAFDDSRSRDTEAELFRDLVSSIRVQWPGLLIGAGAIAFAYASAITTFALSADEEMDLQDVSLGSWAGQGRPVVLLVRAFFDQGLPLPAFSPLVALGLLWLSAAMWGLLFLHAAGRTRQHRLALGLFIVVTTTLPINAYYLMWGASGISVSCGLVLAAASVWFAWLWAAEGWRPAYGLLAAVMAGLAMLTYPSLIGVVAAGVLLAQLASLLTHAQGRGREAVGAVGWRLTMKALVPVALAAVVGALMMTALGACVGNRPAR